MRKLVLALLATTGCNWVFGIEKTDLQPADAVFPDAPYPRMTLAYRQLIGQFVSYPPIAGASVQVGDYTNPLVDSAVDAQGTFALPDPLNAGEYRIVYKLPDDAVPHEVQWSNLVVRDGGRLLAPAFGRVPRTPPPTGSGYALTATQFPPSWGCQSSPPPCATQPGINMTAYTTGSWASQPTAWRRSTQAIGVAAPTMTSIDGGSLGTAIKADSDVLIAITTTTTNGFSLATGYALGLVDDLTIGNYDTIPSKIESTEDGTAATTAFEPGSIHQETRIMSALSALYNKSPLDDDSITAVALPSLIMPSMTILANDGTPNSSVAIPLASVAVNDPGVDCGYSYANPFTNHDLDTDTLRPTVMLYKQFRTRPAHATGTPVLSSGFQAISLKLHAAVDCNTSGGKPPVDVPVGIAGAATFTKLLQFDDTAVTVPQNGFQDLTFSVDNYMTTDDCVVTTYHVTTQLDPIRTITVPVRQQPMLTVHVPTSDFMSGETYAFGIVCRDSYPGAATGDYTAFAGYPQHESQIFPGTFVVSFQ